MADEKTQRLEFLRKKKRLTELRGKKAAPPVPMPEPQTQAHAGPDQSGSGLFWPVSWDKNDSMSFDSNAGLLGGIKRGLSVPGDVMTGKLDLEGPEATGRLLEAATLMSPLGVKARAGGNTGMIIETSAEPFCSGWCKKRRGARWWSSS